MTPFSGDGKGSSALGLVAVGLALTLVWAIIVYAMVVSGGGASDRLGLAVIAVVPVTLIWAMVAALHALRSLEAETEELHATIEALRAAQASPPQAERVSRQAEARKAVLPVADRAEQPTLALGPLTEEVRPPVAAADLVRALNFPDSPEDAEGFRALRLALEDRTVARLIRAAQDVLTLLSQDGIYMDDLVPERPPVALWRRFAAGERGEAVSALGGIHSEKPLALTSARMKADPIFRDAVLHFLRSFDKTVTAVEPTLEDSELAELAATRTARAFMLLGRVAQTFD